MRGDGAVISRGFWFEELPFSNRCVSASTDDEFRMGKRNATDLGENDIVSTHSSLEGKPTHVIFMFFQRR